MKRIILFLTSCVLSALMQLTYAGTYPPFSPIGFWKTIDDASGQPKSIVQIWDANNVLYGKVVKLFKEPARLCVACSGEKQNKPILGMEVLSGFKQSDKNKNEWLGGQILDPKNGKVYHCTIQVLNKGNKLRVRGYIGIPLFGRSQIWLRSDG